jgi:hypothetical protein
VGGLCPPGVRPSEVGGRVAPKLGGLLPPELRGLLPPEVGGLLPPAVGGLLLLSEVGGLFPPAVDGLPGPSRPEAGVMYKSLLHIHNERLTMFISACEEIIDHYVRCIASHKKAPGCSIR